MFLFASWPSSVGREGIPGKGSGWHLYSGGRWPPVGSGVEASGAGSSSISYCQVKATEVVTRVLEICSQGPGRSQKSSILEV